MIAATTLKYAVAWLVLSILFAALTGGLNWLTYWKLVHRSVSVPGTVIQVLPEMHATVRYRYHADGREYYGQAQPRQPNPPIERLAEGAMLTVWYDPEEPKISVIGLPSALLENETISVVSVAVLFPTFILLAWRYRTLSGYRLLWRYVRHQ
jgi:hypothetical protein